MNATRYILIRHAQSTWNAAARWQGHGDPPLSELGQAQAQSCAEQLVGESVDVLVCSDLQRTRQTAAAIGRTLDLEVIPNARLRELDVGDWTGLTRAEIVDREPDLLQRFESGDPDIRPGGGETRREIRSRVRAIIEELAVEHAGRRIVLVVHSGVIKALVPGAEPENTDRVEVTLQEIRSARPEAAGDPIRAPF